MSKVKNAELEEAALVIAEKLLVEIETRVDNLAKGEQVHDMHEIKKVKALVDTYNTLKPYF